MARETYHHGNLKQALVEATVHLIEERGPLAFTLAEAARRAGVSAAAPYRHFAGRDELLTEVARQGYADFGQRLERAFNGGKPSTLGAFLQVGLAYLKFANEKPGYYMTMFEAGLDLTNPAAGPAAEAAHQAFNIMLGASEMVISVLPPEKRPPAVMVATQIWAFNHGIVELFARPGNHSMSPLSPEEMLESGALVYLRGLGVLSS